MTFQERAEECSSLRRRKVEDMTERKIKLRPEEVKDFVYKACKCDFDIDIFYNHYTIDAKSILGVMGLDFNATLTVKYAGYNHDFENCVNKLAVAC